MQETYLSFDEDYTRETNKILSKNMVLESLLLKMIDASASDEYKKPEAQQTKIDSDTLEAVLCLILEQGREIGDFRSVCENDGRCTAELLRVTSKNFGAQAMTERLLNEGDVSGDLAESLITLIQSQFLDIQKLRMQLFLP